MIDKKTVNDIRSLKDFLEFWMKFHALYDDVTEKGLISEDDEKKFLEQEAMVKDKYRDLVSALEFKYAPHSRMTDPVSAVLALEGVRFISEKNLKRLESDWKDSYVFLNSILERLQNKKRRLEQFSPIGVFFKRIMEGRQNDQKRDCQ